MIEPYKELANIGTFLSALASLLSVLVVAIVALIAYRRFTRYEEKQFKSQIRASLNPTLKVAVLAGQNPGECVLGMTVKIQNLGKVTALVDLEESDFLLEQLGNTLYDPNDLLEERDGKKYVKPFSRLSTQFASYRVRMAEGRKVCEVEPGTTISFSNCAPSLRGIYRVSAELAITKDDTIEFMRATGINLSSGERAVWTVSTICDARESA